MQREVLAGTPGSEMHLLSRYTVATLLPSEEPGPDSLEVHGHLCHVGTCEYFFLFHLDLPFLVSTVGAFPKATSFSFFCYLRNWGLMTAIRMEKSK